jgi:hypothetical protein
MKKYFTWILVVATSVACGQGFTTKTNTIHVDYRNEITATTVPRITWITPGVEVTNSLEESITFEADVHSDASLRQVMIEFTTGGETRSKSDRDRHDVFECPCESTCATDGGRKHHSSYRDQ